MKDIKLTRNTIKELEKMPLKAGDPYRLSFHIMPPVGRLNDPNGLSEVDGINHIFFQYTPQSTEKAGQVTWGHYSTPDYIHYTYNEPAIIPDSDFEIDGSYSGSATLGPDGLIVYYTGNVKHKGDFDYIHEGREQNVIKASDFDGLMFNRKEMIMSNDDYPESMTKHVRDPKVYYKDGKFQMALGARDKKHRGAVLFYESEDGENFEYTGKISGKEDMGYMFECPDFFSLDGKDFLILSPQGIEPEGERYNNQYQSGWIELDENPETVRLKDFRELDYGFDFYAPQTYLDEEGRRILIAWMGMIDNDFKDLETEYGWHHALTIPRELKFKNNKLYQKPLEELKALRESEQKFKVKHGKELKIDDLNGAYELVLKLKNDEGRIRISDSLEFKWNKNESELEFTETAIGGGRDKRKRKTGRIKNLRIFVDHSSVEIFINKGESVYTTRFYPKNHNILIKDIEGTVKLYTLNDFTIEYEN